MRAFANIADRVFGRGDFSVTVPPMDGALRANDALEQAPVLCSVPNADNLALLEGRPILTSGNAILALDVQPPIVLRTFESEITCLAGMPDGSCIAGLADGTLVAIGGSRDGKIVTLQRSLACLTALTPLDDDTVIVTNGSERNGPADWTADLLGKGRDGSVWRVTLSDGGAVRIAGGLAFPNGAMMDGDTVVVSEAWASRLVRMPAAGGRVEVVLDNLPGYPARITPDPSGGAWLSVFAPRSQLLEFVLREDEFRARMVRDVPRDYWIAPTLRSGRSFLEPLQAGGVKQLGVLKPWSPSRSYGLLVRLGGSFLPRASYHSRADGSRHGVTSSLVVGDRVYFTAKGDAIVGSLDRETA